MLIFMKTKMPLESFENAIIWVFLNDLSWRVQLINPHRVLVVPNWPVEEKRGRARSWGYGNPGKTPGAGGRLNRSSFPFMSSLWGSSCICCSRERQRQGEGELGRQAAAPTVSNNRVRGIYPRQHRVRDQRKTSISTMAPILANCLITNICKPIWETKPLVTGVQGVVRPHHPLLVIILCACSQFAFWSIQL